jgi:hypothetical protein
MRFTNNDEKTFCQIAKYIDFRGPTLFFLLEKVLRGVGGKHYAGVVKRLFQGRNSVGPLKSMYLEIEPFALAPFGSTAIEANEARPAIAKNTTRREYNVSRGEFVAAVAIELSSRSRFSPVVATNHWLCFVVRDPELGATPAAVFDT